VCFSAKEEEEENDSQERKQYSVCVVLYRIAHKQSP
jgi:hypothetical protein